MINIGSNFHSILCNHIRYTEKFSEKKNISTTPNNEDSGKLPVQKIRTHGYELGTRSSLRTQAQKPSHIPLSLLCHANPGLLLVSPPSHMTPKMGAVPKNLSRTRVSGVQSLIAHDQQKRGRAFPLRGTMIGIANPKL